MKKMIVKLALISGFLGIGVIIPTLGTTTAHAANLSAVPKVLRSSWGTKGEDFYLVKMSKNSYTFSDVKQTKKGNWVLTKKIPGTYTPYVHFKLGKKVKADKVFTINKNKQGFWHIHYKTTYKHSVDNNNLYFKVSGKTLKMYNRPTSKEFEWYTKVPTMASRRAYFKW